MSNKHTITEKILASHSGKKEVFPGELIEAKIDLIVCNDITTPPAIKMLRARNINKVFDREKIVITQDHFIPSKDIKSAELSKEMRDWANEQKLKYNFDIGNHGVCHAIIPEKGFALPGETTISADSHTCTYGAFGTFATGIGSTDLAYAIAAGKLWFKVPSSIKFVLNGKLKKGVYSKDIILNIIKNIGVDGALYKAMEFTGPAVKNLSMEARMTIANMAIEAGGKSGIFHVDDITLDYLKNRAKKKSKIYESDKNAKYEKTYEYDVSKFEPTVAFPHLPSNGKFISEIKENIKIDQAYIGSCTNGRIEDMRIAAEILKNRKVKDGTRLIIVPATTEIWKQSMDEGLFDIFTNAGAAISTPTCGACLGGYMGVLAAKEVCISSTNRNFVGRMGSPESKVYLASPATVAASAIKGFIADPRGFLS